MCIRDRGWITPDNDDFRESDEKIYNREMLRLRASFDRAKAKGCTDGSHVLGVLHYPPVSKAASFSGFQKIFEEYGVTRVIYGHIPVSYTHLDVYKRQICK